MVNGFFYPYPSMLLLVSFGVVAAACLVASFWFIGGDQTLLIVKYGGYWLMLFTFMVFLFTLFNNRSLYLKQPKHFLAANRWVFFAVAGVIFLFFLVQDTWFKITMDEYVLASTSMHMHLEKEVFTASRGYEVNGVFYLLGGYLDKRPYFFAFLVSLVHDLFGYRIENVFFFNAVVSYIFLLALYFIGKLFGGPKWGWLTMLLMAALPLFGFNVTGGGFEIFNLLMLLLTAYLGTWWVKNPNNQNLVAFTYSGLLLAQCRYESILFIFPVGILILYVWWRERKIILPWQMFFAPLILVPYVLQNRMLNQSQVLWQLEEHQSSPFGVHYLQDNLSSAVRFFSHWGMGQSNSLLLLALVLVCFVLWGLYQFHYSAFYPREKSVWIPVAWAFGGTVVFNFILLMFYYWGQLDDPVATRLGLPLHLLAVFFVVFVLSRKPWDGAAGKPTLAACLVFAWCITLPNLALSKYMRGAYDARQIRWANELLTKRPGPLLVLYDFHLAALANGISAVPIGYGIERLPELNFHFENETFSEVLIVRRIMDPGIEVPQSEALQQDSSLGQYFDWERLGSFRLGPGVTAVLDRVQAIHLDKNQEALYQEHLSEFAAARMDPKKDLTAYFSKWLP